MSEVVGCCDHRAGEHGEDGCEHGWEWDAVTGIATVEGCGCEMRGPR